MTDDEFMLFIERFDGLDTQATIALIRATPLSNTWQVSELLEMCDTADEARAVLETSPALAAAHGEAVRALTVAQAEGARVYALLITPDPVAESLYTSVKAAPSPAAARVLFSLAPAAARETVATWLTIDKHDMTTFGNRYREWMLGEDPS